MAIIRSNGILFVDSIPTHTPTGNQARMAFMQDLSQWWVWNGTIWYEMSLVWDIVNAATYILDDTVDIQVQEGGIGRIWRSLGGGGDQEYIEFGADGLKIVQIVGGVEKHIKMLGTTLELYNESGEYKIGDNFFFPLPTDADADHDLVIDSSTSLIGKRVKPKVYKAILAQSGTNAPTATILENTLGEVPSILYSSPGQYEIRTVASLFANNKTFISATLGTDTLGVHIVRASTASTTWIDLFTYDNTDTTVNLLGTMYLTIEVYP